MNELYDRLKLAVKEPKNSFMLTPEEAEEIIKLCDTAQRLREEADEIRIMALTKYRKMYPDNVDYMFMTKEQYDKKVCVYEDRINKAIEYMQDAKKTIETNNNNEIDDYLVSASILLEILKGKSDE